MLAIVVASLLSVSVQDQLSGAEIGDAVQFVSFRTDGKYHAEREEKGGKTVARGFWKLDGSKLEVKVTSCKGPGCKGFGKSWKAEVALTAERAMTLKTAPAEAPLKSGSYYCRSQGCEQRIGVELVSHQRRVDVMQHLLDYLIDKNRTRDVTVVWIGPASAGAQDRSALHYCERDADRGKKGADLVAADLSALGWFDKVTPKSAGKDCLFDVRLTVGDEVKLPATR